MTSITITRDDSQTYDIESLKVINLRLYTDVESVPIPEDDPQVIGLGGKTVELVVTWVVRGDNETDYQNKVNKMITFFVTGNVSQTWTFSITPWNYTSNGVIKEITITQIGGSGYTLEASMTAHLGEVI